MNEAVLEDKGYAYAGIEATEIGGHGRDAEVRSGDIGAGATILYTGSVGGWVRASLGR